VGDLPGSLLSDPEKNERRPPPLPKNLRCNVRTVWEEGDASNRDRQASAQNKEAVKPIIALVLAFA